ncbi:hypothetical protein LTS08_002610 [Lithohypha guttulata]|nr:hypothetical protein LTS08_002610 [Lithohypha guttulata]
MATTDDVHTQSDLNPASSEHANNLGNSLPTTDSQISHSQQISYWDAQTADVDGMLGGYPQVSRIDLQGSKNFIAKVRRLTRISHETNSSPSSTTKPSSASGKDSANPTPPKTNTKLNRVLEGGAGIGRITTGLLLNIAQTVDVVEPLKKFTDVLAQYRPTAEQGRIGQIFNSGLESWNPAPDCRYDVIWNQWCLNHLTDKQVVEYLQRTSKTLTGYEPDSNSEKDNETLGWIMVKENLSTDDWGEDIFDDADSSVTRSDRKWKALFEEAGLKIIKMELQSGFPKSLYPVKMYALRPK